jgi:Tfp pilus assembly protein PilF
MAGTPPQTSPSLFSGRQRGRLAPFRRPPLALLGFVGLWPLATAQAARSCADWSAEVVAVEGRIEIRRNAGQAWTELEAGERVCTGDLLQSARASRATLLLPDGNTFRLDENTAVNIAEPPNGFGSLLELLRGIIHVISRDPRALTFRTPYASAGLEGKEFDIRVDEGERLTEIVVLEGVVNVAAPNGDLKVGSDHVAVVREGQAPSAAPLANPIDRMRWASHYPPLIEGPLPAPEQEPALSQQSEPAFYARRAAARLATARLVDAEADLASALRLAPRDATALALQALVALSRADRDTARTRVAEALAAEPSSVVARLAASYVAQSTNDLSAAEQAVREALAIEPGNAIALTRLAELALAADDTASAVDAATRAATVAPERSAPLVVLGFAHLRAFDTAAAEQAFVNAVELEPDAPLPRLGLGVTAVQRGHLETGRRHLELAVAMDPTNPLTRSYMSKVYDAENRADLTASQIELAKEFDPFDPTAWLYSSLQKLRANRPVEALQDFRLAARINGDRPAYRSRLLLDQDLATRGAALARIHTELGISQLALLDAWDTLAGDPADFTSHRLLSDAYAYEPRHEIARVSELHVSQLNQPANVAPLKPQLGQQNSVLAQRAGPSVMSFDELSSPVIGNGLQLRASGVAGGNGVEGHDLSLAGLHDRVSYSAGHYRFSTDGFRENNDYEQEVANAFVQYRPNADTNLQAELRSSNAEHGDLTAFFNRELYSSLTRFDENVDSLRLGAKHALTPTHALLGSIIYQDVGAELTAGEAFAVGTERDAYSIDAQHVYSGSKFRLQSGVLAARETETEDVTQTVPGIGSIVQSAERTNRQAGVYTYVNYDPVATVTLTAGLSFDSLDNPSGDDQATSPKIGITWRATPNTIVRAAAFETLFGSLTTSVQNAQPRLEPVQVAGFTQLLFGGTADRAEVRGLAVDQELSPKLFAGWQADIRDTERTIVDQSGSGTNFAVTLTERTQRAYVYWLPLDVLSLTARYETGRYGSAPQPLFGYSTMSIDRLPIEVRYFARQGFTIGARASYVDQEGQFQSGYPPTAFDPPPFAYGEDQFWVLDAFIGYRLANRRGLLSLNADNLLDETFQFQDIDPTNPSIFPERLISFRFTLAF